MTSKMQEALDALTREDLPPRERSMQRILVKELATMPADKIAKLYFFTTGDGRSDKAGK